MKRKQINLGDQQDKFITNYSKEYDIGYTEALRRILDIGIGKLNIVTHINNTFNIKSNNSSPHKIARIIETNMKERSKRIIS